MLPKMQQCLQAEAAKVSVPQYAPVPQVIYSKPVVLKASKYTVVAIVHKLVGISVLLNLFKRIQINKACQIKMPKLNFQLQIKKLLLANIFSS